MSSSKNTMVYVVGASVVLVFICAILFPYILYWSMYSIESSRVFNPSAKPATPRFSPFAPTAQKNLAGLEKNQTVESGEYPMKESALIAANKLTKFPNTGLTAGSKTSITGAVPVEIEPVTAEPATARPMTMSEEIRSNLGLSPANKSMGLANPLPTDAEIASNIRAQNEKNKMLNDQLGKRDAMAAKIGREVRSLGSQILCPMIDSDSPGQPHVTSEPPADLVQAVKEKKYIAH